MKIGIMVGQTEAGTYQYLGVPGDIDSLKKIQREIVDNKGVIGKGKDKIKFVKTWISNAAADPISAKKS